MVDLVPYLIYLPKVSLLTPLQAVRELEPQSAAPLILVADDEHLYSLVQADQLPSEPERTFMEIRELLPPLILIDGSTLNEGSEYLASLLLATREYQTPGAIVTQGERSCGVLTRSVIAHILVAEGIPLPDTRRPMGDVAIRPLRFVCRKCSPPRYAIPRQGPPPICTERGPTGEMHGQMERVRG